MPALVAPLLFLACLGTGRTLQRLLGIERAGFLHAAGAGAMALGTWSLLLAAAGIAYAAAIQASFAVAAIVGLRTAWKERAGLVLPGLSWRSPGDALGAVLLAATWLALAWLAWNPLLMMDSYAYHLTIPKQYLLHGGLFATPYEMHPNLFFLAEMLLAYPLSLDGLDFVSAKLPQVFYAGGTALVLAVELRRRGHAAAGWVAGLLVLSSREYVEFAPCAHVDVSLGFFLLLFYIMLARALEVGGRARRDFAIAAGIALGAAIATKITAVAMAAVPAGVAVGIVAWRLRRGGARHSLAAGWRLGLPLLIYPSLVVAPWIVKNVAITGSPLYPFLTGIFPAGQEYATVARDFHASYNNFAGYAPASAAWFRWIAEQVTSVLARSVDVDQFRFVVLFLLGGLLLARRPNALPRGEAMLLAGAAAMLPLVLLSPARRFVMGPAALYVLLGALGIARAMAGLAWTRTPAWRAGLATLGVAALAMQVRDAAATVFPYYAARGPIPRGWFLSGAMATREYFATRDDWPLREQIQREVGGGRLLATDDRYLLAMLDVRVLPCLNIHGKKIVRLLAEEEKLDAAGIAARLRGLGITHLLSADPMDGNAALEAFRREYLEEVGGDAVSRFYRLREKS